jgi:glutamyl-tRNA synthetase
VLVLRIDDTDRERTIAGGEDALLGDLEWLGVAWDEGPKRQSERAEVYGAAIECALEHGAARDAEGAVRLGRTTLARADGTATYQLASVADDLDLGITHVIRGADHRPNVGVQQAIALALGGRLPEVIHHGLVLGDDGKKLSKRHGHASIAALREEGIPAPAVRAYLDELGLPGHDVKLDLPRLRRLSIDAIAAMPNEELATVAGAPLEAVPALRGARDLVEARAYAEQIVRPGPVTVAEGALATLERFAELRIGHADPVGEEEAREIVREVKAVGGDLRAVRMALTGSERGPELWAVLAALSTEETLRRVRAAGARVPT